MEIVVYEHSLSHARPYVEAFARGLQAHGIEPLRRHVRGGPVDADLAVFWGHRQAAIIERQREIGGRYLVLERGYIGDRFAWTSVGFDGLNGRADFGPVASADRWQRLWADQLPVLPWHDGDLAVIIGQVKGDASVVGVDLDAWYARAAEEIRARHPDLVPAFRRHPHPNSTNDRVPGVQDCNEDLDATLARPGSW